MSYYQPFRKCFFVTVIHGQNDHMVICDHATHDDVMNDLEATDHVPSNPATSVKCDRVMNDRVNYDRVIYDHVTNDSVMNDRGMNDLVIYDANFDFVLANHRSNQLVDCLFLATLWIFSVYCYLLIFSFYHSISILICFWNWSHPMILFDHVTSIETLSTFSHLFEVVILPFYHHLGGNSDENFRLECSTSSLPSVLR